MRILERLQYIFACALLVAMPITEGLIIELLYDVVVGLITLGWWAEGFRLS